MDDFMNWLYFHYIEPTLEGTDKGEYAEPIARLRGMLDISQEMDLEMAIQFYADCAFQLGLRTGMALYAVSGGEEFPAPRV